MATTKKAKIRERMALAEVMAALQEAGTEQARKTYRRHGAREPVFGVSFAVLKTLAKRTGTDHELALALWETGNFDARNLAVRIVEPGKMTLEQLDAWGRVGQIAMVMGYVACVAVESPHAMVCGQAWLADGDARVRAMGWHVVAALALQDESLDDDWMSAQLQRIEQSIHTADNVERGPMNQALIAIGCRNAQLRELATAAAVRIGPVEIDHGDTACETVEAAPRIAKTWDHSLSKGHVSPAAHERTRESMRTRC